MNSSRLLHAYVHLVGLPFRTIGLFDALQLPLVIAALCMAFLRPTLGAGVFRRLEQGLTGLAERPLVCVVAIAAAAVAGRALLIPSIGTTRPLVSDEASLILQAQTYLRLQLANHADLSPDFATPFVILKPTYASMYPVLKSFPLVVGGALGIGMWAGVWLSMVLLCVVAYLALQGWIGRRYALVGALLILIRYGLMSSWVNSYWGGAFTAMGGLLLVGGYGNLKRTTPLGSGDAEREGRVLSGVCTGAGVFILMTTRPFEGLLVAAPLAIDLLVHAWVLRGAAKRRLMWGGVAALAFVVAGFGLTLAHNQAVVGNWRQTPFDYYRSHTARTPTFWFEKPIGNPPPAYAPMTHMNSYEDQSYQARRSPYALALELKNRLLRYGYFYVGFALVAPFGIGLACLRRERGLAAAFGLLGFGLLTETWDWPHYAAPGLGIALLIILWGLRAIRRWSPRGQPVGLALSRLLPLSIGVNIALAGAVIASGSPTFDVNTPETPLDADCCWVRPSSVHADLETALQTLPGRNLVIVDSGARWPPFVPVVFNSADVAGARTIWINADSTLNPATLARYPGRRVWRMGWEANGAPCLSLTPGGNGAAAIAQLRGAEVHDPGATEIDVHAQCP